MVGDTNFTLGVFVGHVAAPSSMEFWLNLDEPTRRVMLWDVPRARRQVMLRQAWFNADYVGLAWTGKISPVGASWATRIGPGSNCFMAHFCIAREARPIARDIMLEFLREMRKAGAASFIGLIPAPFRHALSFVETLGYKRAATLRGSCPLADSGRLVDGVLVALNMEDVQWTMTASPAPIQPEPMPAANSSAMTLQRLSPAQRVFA